MRIRVICRGYRVSRFVSSSQLSYSGRQWQRRVFSTTTSKSSAKNENEDREIEKRIGGSLSGFLNDLRYPEKTCDPLRILFFGTDEFSSAVLSALNSHRQALGIKSLDVVCRRPQPSGRGLREHSTSVRSCVEELQIPFHEINSFTPDWKPPTPDNEPINLLIAVSFGLKIPGRVIAAARYGGLNLHPSDLPDLRGAAPLSHTLLWKMRTTRVSLQTLHPTKFDHGVVLARSPPVKIPSDVLLNGSVKGLRELLSPVAASLLLQGLWDRVFVPPLIQDENAIDHPIRPAPKITKEYQHIDWNKWTRRDIKHRRLVLGPLWSKLTYLEKRPAQPDVPMEIRVIFHKFSTVAVEKAERIASKPGKPGTVQVFFFDENKPDAKTLGVWTLNGQLLIICELTVEGDKNGRNPVEALQRLRTGDYSTWPGEMKLS